MYEDTSGLTVGDPVERRHAPLSLELGPGIMDTIFDGIQRPLNDIADLTKDVFIPRGIDIPCLDQSKLWEFTPVQFKEGDMISGGDIFGTVFENEIISKVRETGYVGTCGNATCVNVHMTDNTSRLTHTSVLLLFP